MRLKNTKRALSVAILVLVQLAISGLAPLLSSFLDSYWKVGAVKLVYAVSFIVPYMMWKRMFKPVAVSFSKHRYCEYKLPLFFVGFAAIVACLQINIVFLELFAIRVPASSTGMFDGVIGVVFSALMYVLIPSVTEEMFSRGVILRLAGGGVLAAVLSGVLFGLCHFNPYQLIYSVGAGIVLGVLYLYTQDLRISVYLHLAVNATVLVLSYVSKICSAGVYVAIECVVWLTVLLLGVYFCRVLLKNHGLALFTRTAEIRENKKDITVREIFSPAMLVVYAAIIAATVLRFV